MPSSWSPSLRFELQFTGENINLWGDKLNATLARADYAIAGWLTKPLTGDAALSTANGADDEARAAMIKFTGMLTAPATVTLPAVSKSYFVWNAAQKTLTFTTGAGASVAVEPGDKVLLHCDGAGVHTLSFGGLPLKDYVAAVQAGSGAVPGPAGAAGKYLFSDGAAVYWRQVQSADLADTNAILGKSIALALAVGG